MRDETNPLFLLYSIALAQFLFLIIALFLNKKHERPVLLSLTLFIFSAFVIIAEFLLIWSGYLREIPWILGISVSFQFLLGPLFLALVFLSEKKKLKWQYYFHFVPSLVIFVSFLFSLPGSKEVNLEFYTNEISTEQAFSNMRYLLGVFCWILHLVLYCALAIWYHNKQSWVLSRQNGIIFSVLIISVVLLFIHISLLYFDLPYYALTYCIFIGILSMLGFRLQWEMVVDRKSDDLSFSDGERNNSRKKYTNSGLSQAIVDKEKERIEKVFQQKMPFLATDLSLSSLANELELSTHHLSQVINQGFKVNFSDFINSERIRYSLDLLKDSQVERTIEQIAYESGFNSRASYHRAFKKVMGQSPSYYRNSQK